MTVKKKKPKRRVESWACLGFDCSLSSVAVAGVGYSATLDQFTGPVFSSERFTKDTHYYDRLKFAVRSADQIWDLSAQLKLPSMELDRIFIAIEEPFPLGMVGSLVNRRGKFQSGWVKQQSQMTGALIAGLVSHGFVSVYEINNSQWRKVVADQLGITTHHTKWTKDKPKEWALANFNGVPDLPDLIQHSKLGLTPRPEGSRAKAVQPEDIYDALGICMWMVREMGFQWESPRSKLKKKVKANRKGAS